MKLYHRCILVAGAVVWFLLFWNLPEQHAFKSTTTILIKAVSVVAAVVLIYYAFTASAEHSAPAIYDFDEDENEDEEKKEEAKDTSS